MPKLSTKARKYLIVKKAKIIDVIKPTSNDPTLIICSEDIKSMTKKTNAPNIVGIASMKENFEASLKFRPINSAAVIAVPDLEAPGNKAKT